MDSFSTRLKQALENKNISQAELARRTGIGRNSISDYINGKYEAKQDKLYLLAKALDVSESWLMGYNVSPSHQKRNEPAVISLLTDLVHQLDPPRQEKVYGYAEEQLEKQQPSTNSNVLEFEQYRESKIVNGRSSAAGAPLNGDIQDGEASVMVVDQREIPSNADEIITIAGDSMEPLILNGEQVFIHWTPVVEQGEIALVSIIDEGVTCKKVYWDNKEFTLRSINEKYDDMVYPLSDVRIIGKVL